MFQRLCFLLLGLWALGAAAQNAPAMHPSWINNGNIYEVNVRQFTPEGTFKAFEKHLPRLKAMGVQTLWFMPIQPISVKDRKGKLGSYYAISNYIAVNPEYGTMADWKALVNKAHDMGFKVVLDWVANHTGADHYWLTKHPDFYVKDAKTGQPVSPFDWTDVRKLDYKNPVLRDSMIADMRFWIIQSGIDGYRCDVAAEVPKDFWSRAIKTLRATKNMARLKPREPNDFFMLAEANEAWLHEAGFDATYGWDEFATMKRVASGERGARSIDSSRQKIAAYPKGALRMLFTSNHDENSWNKADYGTMPGAVHAPFAVLTFTQEQAVPLIYSGQEEPFLDSLSFFYKDTITFRKYGRAAFYKQLTDLRRNNPAMASDAQFVKLQTTNDVALYAFERRKGKSKVLVVLNLSAYPQELAWKTQPSQKTWYNVFGYISEPVDAGFQIEPWGYAVYEVK